MLQPDSAHSLLLVANSRVGATIPQDGSATDGDAGGNLDLDSVGQDAQRTKFKIVDELMKLGRCVLQA